MCYNWKIERVIVLIKYNMSIDDINTYQTGKLPDKAIKMDSPCSVEEMMKKSSPIAVVLCIFLFVVMFTKTIMSKTVVVSPLFVILGFIIGFLLLIVHEWLHAIVYPREAEITIGKLKGKITFVALASYPMKRSRFICMCLLPFVLGIIPLFIFLFTPASCKIVNSVMFGMSCMGMISPFPDVFNVFLVLKQTNKNDFIMFFQDDLYKINELE